MIEDMGLWNACWFLFLMAGVLGTFAVLIYIAVQGIRGKL